MKKLSIALVCISITPLFASVAAARTFEECQEFAIAHGVSSRYSTQVFHNYLRYKTAGTAYHPRGLIARCMAGK